MTNSQFRGTNIRLCMYAYMFGISLIFCWVANLNKLLCMCRSEEGIHVCNDYVELKIIL